ncbi:hypothetical protein JCM19240_4221 [Vibrio maritimus]|uniref:Major facilitator superfamily associated domain-containing protein n=1 Tax=Vibrio maritimus TaxID=990268 RepID=A0A090T409_9VIBR|nr:hypothetical protein JCM19240_4221 [Vibrio maritimus]
MLIRLQYFLNGFFKGCLPLFVPYYLGFGIDLNAIFTMMAIVMALYSLACPTFSVISDATNKIKIFTLVGYSLLAAMFAALHVIDPAANFGLVTTVIVIGYIAFAGCLGLSDKYSNLSCLKSGGDYGKIYIFDPVGILASQVILMVVGEQYVMSLLLMAAILLVLVATWQDYDAILADIQKVPVAEFLLAQRRW